MPALKTSSFRAECPVCFKMVPVRKNGTLREHYVYRPQMEQEPLKPLGRVRVCEGTGRAA